MFSSSARMIGVVVLASLAVACGGGGSTPTAPTPPVVTTPTVTGVTVSGLDAVRFGFFANFTAQAASSNGTSAAVTPTWSSSNTAVATVAANGDVTGVSNGVATITATHQGVSGSKGVRIVSNFGVNWTGTYRLTKCDQSVSFAGWCAAVGGVGAVLPFSLALTQGGTTRDVMSGTFSLGSIAGDTTGNVTGDGRLILGGTFTNNISGVVFVVTIGGWDTRLSGATGMTGVWSNSVTANGFAGNAFQENTIVTATHTSFGASVPTQDTLLAATRGPSGNYALSWPDFFALLRRPY